ncbi:Uncharacterised protein [Suttonella indologenes]|uniref:Uncharacterized protein n=1 Tax=Suttonella indologenes TaxID=13276 RepID=A0A380MI48_9GAMM|nr:Uncharacterised protein [Suttonella indologenes]
MFQHTERHIKRRSTCCPELEEVTPLPQIILPKGRGFNQ